MLNECVLSVLHQGFATAADIRRIDEARALQDRRLLVARTKPLVLIYDELAAMLGREDAGADTTPYCYRILAIIDSMCIDERHAACGAMTPALEKLREFQLMVGSTLAKPPDSPHRSVPYVTSLLEELLESLQMSMVARNGDPRLMARALQMQREAKKLRKVTGGVNSAAHGASAVDATAMLRAPVAHGGGMDPPVQAQEGVQCYNCKNLGHIRRKCPFPPRRDAPQPARGSTDRRGGGGAGRRDDRRDDRGGAERDGRRR